MADEARDITAIKRLLAGALDSFEKLEIVVHIHRTGFAVVDPEKIAKAISISVDEVTTCVQTLRAKGVLDPQGPWRGVIDALVERYDDDRIEVMNLMTKTALERVRQEAARVFADAFVLRPKKKGDPDA